MLSYAGRALVVLAAAATTACGGNTLGTIGEVLGGAMGQPASGGQAGQLTAEVRSVNTQGQTIAVATNDGRTGNVRYDQNTVVVYQNRQYPVTALERGDVVLMQVQDVQGTLYTQRIDVQQSASANTGTNNGAVRQFSGRVAQMDLNNGRFVLQTQNGNVTVALPYNAPKATVDYFRRLRNGDAVNLEATVISDARVEIHRFL